MKKITDDDVVYTFSLDKKTFNQIWHWVFGRNHTPYAYDERDRLWDLMCCEHANKEE